MAFQPMPMSRRPAPFDHPDWIFELKYDGFRACAVIERGRTQLISRNGHSFTRYADLCKEMTLSFAGKTVIDGEIVCVDKRGRPQFRDLLFHRGMPCFFAFDLPMSNGKDLRTERLIDRKQELRRILDGHRASRLRYANHVERRGVALFHRICELDLEGVVAKLSHGPYVAEKDRTTWFKVRNSNYSQWEGREELFERERHSEPTPGWHSCDLACVQARGFHSPVGIRNA